ncbi:MAG: ATP-binding protein [Sphingomonadaceae bacterium]|nr:ATP-binding protein [Sphingomonadaceae bacterium]
MTDQGDPLARIADALERLAPPPAAAADWLACPAYVWDGATARGIAQIEAPELAQLCGIDAQKDKVSANVLRHAKGHAAHDMLLWGARGMGKSALVRAATVAAQQEVPGALALVQAGSDSLGSLPALFDILGSEERRFLVYIDDLGFAEDDSETPRRLRSWLEGGVEARPNNVRLAVTSNRRAIQARHLSEQDDPINPRDATDDRLALADRFGISVGFHNCDKPTYLAIIATYAEAAGLAWEEGDAMEWAARRGARSGRTAWQYVTELAGRAGKRL